MLPDSSESRARPHADRPRDRRNGEGMPVSQEERVGGCALLHRIATHREQVHPSSLFIRHRSRVGRGGGGSQRQQLVAQVRRDLKGETCGGTFTRYTVSRAQDLPSDTLDAILVSEGLGWNSPTFLRQRKRSSSDVGRSRLAHQGGLDLTSPQMKEGRVGEQPRYSRATYR